MRVLIVEGHLELCGTLTWRALEAYWHLLSGFQRVIVVVMNGRI
jgi:hypothetical protein